MSSKLAKRQRTSGLPSFGAPSAPGDVETFQTNEPSSRSLVTSVPSLVNLCERRFVLCFKGLREHNAKWKIVALQLQKLPEYIIPKLFTLLGRSHPRFLPHEIIVTHFLRGSSISISFDVLPGANRSTVLAIPRLNAQVRDLELSAFREIEDVIFAKVVSDLPSLRSLALRNCSKVGSQTIAAIVKSCPDIRALNLSDTSVSPAAIAELLLTRGSELEVLKLAGLKRWTDSTFMAQLHPLVKEAQVKMLKLRTLKLRSLQLSDSSIDFLISLCPNLRRLDVSFTAAKRPALFTSRRDLFSASANFSPPSLEKLSLTSTPVTASDLLLIIPLFPDLQTLSIGALGAKGSMAMGTASAVTLNDTTLQQLTVIMQSFSSLQYVSLVSNTRLGTVTQTALFNFIQQVGRKCLYLNLSGLSSLHSNALSGLLPLEEDQMAPPALETLLLNNTGVNDDAQPYIACCPNLVRLELERTKFTTEGLFPILDACLKLQVLNLTSCRGVGVTERRQFFEVWQARRNKTI